jgi:hypothetical protein
VSRSLRTAFVVERNEWRRRKACGLTFRRTRTTNNSASEGVCSQTANTNLLLNPGFQQDTVEMTFPPASWQGSVDPDDVGLAGVYQYTGNCLPGERIDGEDGTGDAGCHSLVSQSTWVSESEVGE